MKNIVIAPFHDWRKIMLEGFRTRDSHFIEKFQTKCEQTIIINRPTTSLEIILKRKPNLIKAEVIKTKGNFKLYKYSNKLYVIDYVSNDILGQVFGGYNWFIKKYGSTSYIKFINEILGDLDVKDNYALINQNIFAYELSKKLKPKKSIFDAWDNFAKFNVYKNIKDKIIKAYNSFSKTTDFWITNSKDNIEEFKLNYKVNKIHLIKNGVDVSRFIGEPKTLPEDMKNIKRPIAGFGGKITHLIDFDLVNKVIKKSPNVSFVFVGQILNKDVFKKINKADNFYYLGDKHYDVYPDYVKNFDFCTVPYVVDEKRKSGANTIKVYEYLATGKKVIGTESNGLEDLKDYVYIIDSAETFTETLKEVSNDKPKIDLKTHSWETKTQEILDLLYV